MGLISMTTRTPRMLSYESENGPFDQTRGSDGGLSATLCVGQGWRVFNLDPGALVESMGGEQDTWWLYAATYSGWPFIDSWKRAYFARLL